MIEVPTIDDLRKAHQLLSGDVIRTPVLRCDLLNQICEREVWVKAECLQWTGSFKYRGARNRVLNLTDKQRKSGVVAYSSGNHAQGVALAAKRAGIACLIVMPFDTPKIKIDGVSRLGGEVVLYDRLREDRVQIATDICQQRQAILIPPFDDPWVIAGQGTIGIEIAEDVPDLSVVVVNTGGGGLTAGIALALQADAPSAKLYTCEPEGFDDHHRSFVSGKRERNKARSGSICDALLAEMPGKLTFSINQSRVSGGLTVTDQQVLAAMKFAFLHLKLVLEPGGAAALASALNHKIPSKGPVCVVATGGNVDPVLFTQALSLKQ